MNLFYQFFAELYKNTNRPTKRWIFKIIDCFILMISIYLAFCLRFDTFNVWDLILRYKIHIYILIPTKILLFWIVGMYRPVIRYAGLEFIGTAIKGILGGTILFTVISFAIILPQFPRILQFPRSIIIIDAFLTLVFIILARIVVRQFLFFLIEAVKSDHKRENIIIYGAGRIGSQLIQSLSQEKSYKVICFVDDNPKIQKNQISGKTVYSPLKLTKLIEKYKVDSIILAIQSAGKKRSLDVINQIKHHNVHIKTVPDINKILTGEISINEIRKIDIIDLLGREEVSPDPTLLSSNIQHKVVLVTGAGGSIGSELCRQIAMLKPNQLILYERNEFALYQIDIELKEQFPELEIIPVLGSVTIKERLEEVFTKYNIDTIYHAAAYKHVPLIESNIVEGIYNNVIGTLRCVQAAENHQISTFVFISTDKAVRPTNVMGATKRVAELILQAFARKKNTKTCFIMVRFGNVLDSAGSVIPRFRKQIEEGKNLTVTHKDINRYFMSIPEASRLVIQAGALGEGGDVFLLDMGEPVRIYDLALQMIELSGFKLGDDIDINITGLRPGEKLYEELLIDKTKALKTSHPKIFTAQEKFYPWEILQIMLKDLKEIIKGNTHQDIISQLQKIVPEFKPDNESSSINKSKKVISFSSNAS